MQHNTTMRGVTLNTNWEEFVDVYTLLSPDEQSALVRQAKFLRVERKLKKIIIVSLSVYIAYVIISLLL